MELNLKLKEWRNQQHESEQQQQQQQQQQQHGSVLPLFVTERQQQEQNNNIKHNNNNNNNNNNHLSAFSESSSSTTTPTRLFSRMGSYFNPAQWQELELQALIYRYMLAGADVPAELLYPIKKSLFNSSQFYLHQTSLHQYPHYQPAALLQPAGYWGRGALDPEPGRCRRTDGKKWRCSRDVVAAHKYCERHMHRGRNRSRKPVETAATLAVANRGGCGGLFSKTSAATVTVSPSSSNADKMSTLGGHFSSSGPSSSIGLLQLNPSSSKSMTQNKTPFESQNEKLSSVDQTSDGRVLRCFFDDWPQSLNDRENGATTNARSTTTSAADISLKLSTGTDDSDTTDRSQLNWASSWGAAPVEVAHMGGPLAEALRSSVSNSTTSPNSVLQELQKASVSETTSYVST